jgi:flagellar biosynthesis protein FlhG
MRSIAVTSGKGGVGKTTITANLAMALAAKYGKVLVFDADLGLANLDIQLGMRPQKTLSHVVRDGTPLSEAVTEGPGGIHLIAGGSGVEDLVRLPEDRLSSILTELTSLAETYDWLLIDTAAGIHEHVLMFATSTDQALIVCTPDPSSIMDAYATAKSLFNRRSDATAWIVINCADAESQGRYVFEKLRQIIGQFLNRSVQFAGVIRRDSTAAQCFRTREAVFLKQPKSNASKEIAALADTLAGHAQDEPKFSFLEKLKASLTGAKNKAA